MIMSVLDSRSYDHIAVFSMHVDACSLFKDIGLRIFLVLRKNGPLILYKYDIPVWCTTGITSPREECRPRATLLSRGSYSCCTPHRDVIFVLLYRTTYKTQKGEN